MCCVLVPAANWRLDEGACCRRDIGQGAGHGAERRAVTTDNRPPNTNCGKWTVRQRQRQSDQRESMTDGGWMAARTPHSARTAETRISARDFCDDALVMWDNQLTAESVVNIDTRSYSLVDDHARNGGRLRCWKLYYDSNWSVLEILSAQNVYRDAIVILIMYATWFDL